MQYKYGVSFNCTGRNVSIGGGEEGDSSLDYVGDDLEKIEKYLEEENPEFVCSRKGEEIGEFVDVGQGPIVSILRDKDPEEEYIVAVIFEDPVFPTVIE